VDKPDFPAPSKKIVMDQDNQNQSNVVPQNSAEFGSVQNDSAPFGSLPHDAENFGTMPHDSVSFRNVPPASKRKENHTMTVREVARLFEAAGVARSERSIVNWCQPNRQGISRLDSYFDPNERKYFITPQSVDAAITEEKARASAKTPQPPESGEHFRTVPKDAEAEPRERKGGAESESERTRELERENLDLKIANRGKDYLIEQMQKERTGFFDQLLTANRKVGELETRLLRLVEPHSETDANAQ
jgi:hypothetical protein